MSIPLWTLLGFATWTIVLLFTTVGYYRWTRILTNWAQVKDFRAVNVSGKAWYRRAMRAHANCVENIYVYTAIVFALEISGLSNTLVDVLAVAILISRLCQSLVHVSWKETNFSVSIPFAFFFIQAISKLGIVVSIGPHRLE